MRRCLLLAAVSVAVAGWSVAVTGWAGASAEPVLSHAALVAGLDAACSKDHATVVALRKQAAGFGHNDYKATARLFGNALTALRTERADIDKLIPPTEELDLYHRFRGVIVRETTYTRQTIAALGAQDLKELGRLMKTAASLRRQQIRAASAVGAAQCKKV